MESRPLVVQSDRTMLMDVHDPASSQCRDTIVPFSELVKSPEHLHTYQITRISLWNACSAGLGEDDVMSALSRFSRYEIPETVEYFIRDTCRRYGVVRFTPLDDRFFLLECTSELYRRQVLSIPAVRDIIIDDGDIRVPMNRRGDMKVILIDHDFPVQDLIPLKKGRPLEIALREVCASGAPFLVRDYQREAFDALWAGGAPGAGYGTVVLPCGSGKTIVGLVAMARLKTSTLILAPNVASVHQWRREILDKTTLEQDDVGEFTSERRDIRPVTIATYSMLIWRSSTDEEFHNFDTISAHEWGFVIYDEVHMLPAPVFKLSSSLQAVYRLGLTATLVREDGREKDVFSLVGPKRYDVPWSQLEKRGFIARAYCHELRIAMSEEDELAYAMAPLQTKIVIAAKNGRKLDVVARLLERHEGEQILIIGQYLDQLRRIAGHFALPLITGSMPNATRDRLYQDFRDGRIRILVVSKVANFAIDLPDASVAIQVSGTFGSRQEEAQRLGRILRPKMRDSNFYTLVTRHSREEDFSLNRQKFLIEQGYAYSVEDV